MKLVQIRTLPSAEAHGDPSRPVLVDRVARTVRYLRVSLTDRCSMRCTYCMPPEGIEHVPRQEVLSLEEIVEMVAAFARWGVERVRLTGGEPTLRRDLVWLVEQLAAIPLARPIDGGSRTLRVVMTTNGERLDELAAPLRRAGLEAVNVSIDSLDRERFAAITRRDRLARVKAGIRAAQAAGLAVKTNTVALRGFNDDELAQLCRFAWEHDATPRFIELMPMAAGRLYVPGTLMPAAEIRERVIAELGGQGRGQGRGQGTGQAERSADAPDAGGANAGALGPATYVRVGAGPYRGRRFGTIAAMTENFCSSCNRLRVSATGQLHACLARDESGDVRAALRGQEHDPQALERVVRAALGHKRDAHGFELDGGGGPDKAMISIGG